MKILLIGLLLFLKPWCSPPGDPVVVIVNVENKVSDLSLTEVRMYWMRRPKKRWEEIDKLIKPVDLKGQSDTKSSFYSKVLKMEKDIVESYFTARQYQNGEKSPDLFSTDKEIINFIGNEIGAIGYVKRSSLDAQSFEKVKIVFSLE